MIKKYSPGSSSLISTAKPAGSIQTKRHSSCSAIKFSGWRNLNKRNNFQRYLFRTEYEGTAYGGWQRQHNAPSIQEEIENAFATVVRSPCRIVGAGRTDAGVHARRQAAHIDLKTGIDTRKLRFSVNSILPPDIHVYDLKSVSPEFHARYDATKRSYRYYLNSENHPLVRNRTWTVVHKVNWQKTSRSVSALCGAHDFSAFCSSGCGTENMVCTVSKASLTFHNDGYIFCIEADRFLYKMVRSIVGTLVDVGRGKIRRSLAAVLRSRDRNTAGQTAPSKGLVLHDVLYPEEL
ncbi:MAG: tRNA pseudouridine(38-40) synthase TruA [Chitinivibrionales bacterium]|nr:tRNA pseudouridine(38-40) synthase TruA [Chitinivibrionales bacterium]